MLLYLKLVIQMVIALICVTPFLYCATQISYFDALQLLSVLQRLRDGSVRVWKIVEESQLIFNGPSTSIDAVKLINEEHFITCGEDG